MGELCFQEYVIFRGEQVDIPMYFIFTWLLFILTLILLGKVKVDLTNFDIKLRENIRIF